MIGSSASAVRFLAGIGMSFFKDSSPGKAAAAAASADGLALVTVTLLDSAFEWNEETEKEKYKHKKHAQIKANWSFLECKSKERILYITNSFLRKSEIIYSAVLRKLYMCPGVHYQNLAQSTIVETQVFFRQIDSFKSVVGITHYKFRW